MVSRAGHGRAGDGGRAARRLAALLALILAGPLAGSLHFKENWLWMDEVLSFLLITDPSIQHMNAAIVSGMDANPPLFPNVYWVLAHAVAANPYFLRDVSIVLFALTAAVFYWYIDRLRRAPALNFLLVLATLATTYLNFTLATQVRSYALFLAVAAGYFISAHRLLLRPGGRAEWLWHTGAGLLLVFTHNFGLFYLAVSGAGFGVLALVDRRAASWLPLASLAVILGAWVQFWMPSFLIQARAGDPHSWIPLPTWRTFFATAGELAPSLSSRLERVPGSWCSRSCAAVSFRRFLFIWCNAGCARESNAGAMIPRSCFISMPVSAPSGPSRSRSASASPRPRSSSAVTSGPATCC